MNQKQPLIVLTGPTASGKSGLAVQLAQEFSGEIISADSMQIYQEMNVGTAKTTPQEMKGIPHHLQDFLSPDQTFSVADYAEQAKKVIDDIHEREHLPFLVGGTGLYLQAVADNIQFFHLTEDPLLRKQLLEYANTHGNQVLWNELNQRDPILAGRLHPNNRGRIIRGIEVFESSGEPLSRWQERSRSVPSPYATLELGLAFRNRELLYQRIHLRVEEMLQEGLLEETRELFEKGFSKTAQQAIGYKELLPVVTSGEDLEVAVDRLKQGTRRYAKRQLTWMRGRKELVWIYRDDFEDGDQLLLHTKKIINDWLTNKTRC